MSCMKIAFENLVLLSGKENNFTDALKVIGENGQNYNKLNISDTATHVAFVRHGESQANFMKTNVLSKKNLFARSKFAKIYE